MHSIRASARHSRAIHSIAELLDRLKIDAMFVGHAARSAWLGSDFTSGAVDVLALMNPPQKNQLAMMASHRGYRVDKEEIEQTEELDLVPLNFLDEEGEVRVHVLVASNALYGRMVSSGEPAEIEGRQLKVPRAEDLALMLLVGEDEIGVRRLMELPGFDLAAFEQRLVSIGLRRSPGGAER